MPKYVHKPTVVEAIRWFKNGDHPKDNREMVRPEPNSTTRFEPFLGEGEIVRRWNNPEYGDEAECLSCGLKMNKHGWIDAPGGSHTVCPGDWVVTGVDGKHYPVKNKVFETNYEEVEE